MPLEMPRRRFLQVLTGIIAAPAVIKAEGLMKVAAAPDRVLYRETYLRPMLADAYGRSPGMDALPDILQLHTMTRRQAEAIEKLVRPPMLASVALKNQPSSIRGWIPPAWREIVRLCDIDTTPTQAQTASAERDLPILRAASGRDIEPTA